MKKISLMSSDNLFSEDISQQIMRFLPDAEIVINEVNDGCDIILVDENEKELKKLSEENKELPIIFFSSKAESSKYADIVINKPFNLIDFLMSLKNETILPKVRQKECINFKEYSFYPVKKEIISHSLGTIIKLTEREVDILKYLYKNSSNIINKEDMLEDVWGYSNEATTHTVETHIYRLRQKIEQEGGSQLILTENGGYKLDL